MHEQCIYQRRSDSACITKVPLPPVRSQAGAGYLVTPGMGISEYSGMQTATCASISSPYKLTLQYEFDDTPSLISPIVIARSIEHMFPNDPTICISQNPSNKHLTIEVSDDTTYGSLLNLNEINGSPVKIDVFCLDISTKGIFHCEEELNLTESEEKQVKEQGVTQLYRIKHTDKYAVTFDRRFLPETLMISRLAFEVSLYVPKPRRCFRCQRYGHTENHCLHPRICPRCSDVGHTFEECKNKPSCYHCFGHHSTSSRDCPRFILEQLVLEYKVTNLVDFQQARTFIYKSYPDIVNKIPRLKSPFSTNKPDSENSLVENIVVNLNKTIQAQQSQIDILIGELRECKSLINSKSFVSETSQMTQTDSLSHAENMPVCDHVDIDLKTVSNENFPCENAIPQIPVLQTSESDPFLLHDTCEIEGPQLPNCQSSPLPNDALAFTDYIEKATTSSLDSSLSIPDDVSSGTSDLLEETELSLYDADETQEEIDPSENDMCNECLADSSSDFTHVANEEEVLPQTPIENSDDNSSVGMSTLEKTELSDDFIEVIYDRRGRLIRPSSLNDPIENEVCHDQILIEETQLEEVDENLNEDIPTCRVCYRTQDYISSQGICRTCLFEECNKRMKLMELTFQKLLNK